jgi:DNA-directed RNA polymerase I, II, and III subunit RPABC1
MNLEEKKNLYKARRTLLELVEDRGYPIPEEELISFEQFCVKYDSKEMNIYIDDTIRNKHMFIYFYNELKSFGKNELTAVFQKIREITKDENISILIILKEKENSSVSKGLSESMYQNVEIFLRRNLMMNITKHLFAAKHILVEGEEKENEILTTYKTTKSKLPALPVTDPVSKYYGFKPGQMIKIIRRSPIVGESILYRVVV